LIHFYKRLKMSWQQYIDDQLLATKQVKEAVILGHDGNVWAASQDFSVTPEELKKIVDDYNSVDTLAQSGLTVAGTRYMYISSNDKVVRAKKGTGGLHLVKTVQAIIIASYAEPVTAEQCAVVTEKLGDYLVSVGY